ncbi:helix-turn-helix domain-containing protein [Micromonospora arborensis]|uniref:helix-turn-helix domain-containing protein n=1 Tax=Micromonospora arborensis TaxID=2116518 RepID=UPI0037125A2D
MDDSRTPPPQHPDELFAARLNELFEEKRRPDGKRWENSQVAAVIGKSRQAIHSLRHPDGGGRGPTFEMITLLAGFFDVDPNWFFRPLSEGPKAGGDELTTRLASLGVTHVAANQVGEDLAQMRKTVLQVLATIERMEAQANGQADTSPPT